MDDWTERWKEFMNFITMLSSGSTGSKVWPRFDFHLCVAKYDLLFKTLFFPATCSWNHPSWHTYTFQRKRYLVQKHGGENKLGMFREQQEGNQEVIEE